MCHVSQSYAVVMIGKKTSILRKSMDFRLRQDFYTDHLVFTSYFFIFLCCWNYFLLFIVSFLLFIKSELTCWAGYIYIFFFFGQRHVAYRILVPSTKDRTHAPCNGRIVLTTRPPGSSYNFFLNVIHVFFSNI